MIGNVATTTKCLPRKRIVSAKPSRKDASKTGIERHRVRQPLEVIRMSLMNYWCCSGKLQPLLHSRRNESPLAKTRPRVQRTETTTVTMTAVRAKIKSTDNISHGSGDNGKGENSFLSGIQKKTILCSLNSKVARIEETQKWEEITEVEGEPYGELRVIEIGGSILHLTLIGYKQFSKPR
mmetsp:Transcript_30311/g.54889  ORF Transcript_30311/g.54889 Transcript_30311/m.54889 type:complete len:180 (-) Transcript_30311:32-571(-)